MLVAFFAGAGGLAEGAVQLRDAGDALGGWYGVASGAGGWLSAGEYSVWYTGATPCIREYQVILCQRGGSFSSRISSPPTNSAMFWLQQAIGKAQMTMFE